MKWSVQQLEKLTTSRYAFDYTSDFSEEIKQVEDILDINPISVSGTIERLEYGTYRVKNSMKGILVLQCALTLDPVDYELNCEYDEVFSTKDCDEYFLIENNTLNMDVVIWTNILMEKPLSVTLPNAYEILKERGIDIIEHDDIFKEE